MAEELTKEEIAEVLAMRKKKEKEAIKKEILEEMGAVKAEANKVVIPEELMPKKLAALEVYNRLKVTKLVCIISIVGFFVAQIAGLFNFFAAAVVITIFSILICFYLYKANVEAVKLLKNYRFFN